MSTSAVQGLKNQKIAIGSFFTPGMFWFLMAVVGALVFFQEGFDALLAAWQVPEYSHGPLIPVLSLLLFLRQLKEEPVYSGPVNRKPGLILLAFTLVLALMGKLANVDDFVAYALIFWTGAILLISFGWDQGKRFWPPVVHLVYMLPLPDMIYYQFSTYLQGISSELGVLFLKMIGVPVFLEGNIIDLGVLKLHVAEACSGLRYLFPILSFSYIFAVLYKGPMWHKAVLLLAAAPITIFMNSVRIAFAGWLVNYVGVGWLEGFTHFFEGWVIFLISIILLFILAWLLLFLHPEKPKLVNALDLETDGLGTQAARLRLIEPSRAMIGGAVLVCVSALVYQFVPVPEQKTPLRDPLAYFPSELGEWQASTPEQLDADVARILAADDYHSVNFTNQTTQGEVGLFIAYYKDQMTGGTHSPEVCLPGAGWEFASLEPFMINETLSLDEPFEINRAVIQKGTARMMVYYWYEQSGRHIANDTSARFYLLWDKLTIQRSDSAIVRLLTPIHDGESDAEAEARLQSVFLETIKVLPKHVPDR